VLLSTLIFSLYWGFNVYQMVLVCMQACQMRSFYKEQLGIVSDESLETMLWSEVVSRLVQCQKETRLCIVQEELTALEITNIIMRQEILHPDIDSGFQILQLEFTALFAYPRISSHVFATEVYTKAPLWNILLAIFPPVGVRAAAFAAKPVAFVAFVALDLGQILGHPWPLSVETCRQKPWIIVADCGKNSSTDPRPCCT
ncbi:unnamed protein product, partial [Cladocopium goreaui]